MSEMVEPAILAVALAGRVDEREIARLAGAMRRLDLRRQVELLECQRDLFGKSDADEAAGCDRVAIANEPHGLGRGNNLSLLRAPQIRQCRMLRHVRPSWFPTSTVLAGSVSSQLTWDA